MEKIKKLIAQKSEALKLSGNTYFLSDSAILNFPREDGDNRYPLDVDGYTVWVHSSGYIYAREGGFYSLAWRQEGDDPDVDFFGGIMLENGKYEWFSLLGLPAERESQKIYRYSVFTPSAAYYFTEYDDVEFCVRVFVYKERNVFFTVYVNNNSNTNKKILLSTYLNPFISKKDFKHYDDRWAKDTTISDSAFNNLKTSITRFGSIYSITQSNISVNTDTYLTTSSRDDYVGGKSRSLCNNSSLSVGKFKKSPQSSFGTHCSIYGDIKTFELKAFSGCREEIRFKVFADEILKTDIDYKLDSEIIDNYLKELEDKKAFSDNQFRIRFGKSNDPQLDDEKLNYFLQFVKRQIEFCSFGKYYAWSDHLGIRDVWQQLQPTLFWKTEEFKKQALNLLNVIGEDGRAPRQYGPPILNFPISFDLREYIDQGVWILATLNTYLKYSGDIEFFKEICGYYKFSKEHLSITEVGFALSEQKDTVAEHMIRILDFLLSKRDSKTGCVRILYGDWNDPLKFKHEGTIREDGYGDAVSVMASLQVYSNISDVIEVLASVDSQKYADKISYYKEQKEILGKAIIKEAIVTNNHGEKRLVHGWGDNKSFYVGSFCDQDGKSRKSLVVQAYWILSGLCDAEPELLTTVLENIRSLDSKYGFKTFDEPFDEDFKGLYCITSNKPGTLENSTAYIHASTFALAALFKVGEYRDAWDQFKKIIPITHEFTSHSPYVMSNAYMNNTEYSIDGESVNDWMTGSSTVILKTIVGSVCGYQPNLDGIIISPAAEIPFEDFEFTAKAPKYDIKIIFKKSDISTRQFTVNGEKYEPTYNSKTKSYQIFIPYNEINNDLIIKIEG